MNSTSKRKGPWRKLVQLCLVILCIYGLYSFLGPADAPKEEETSSTEPQAITHPSDDNPPDIPPKFDEATMSNVEVHANPPPVDPPPPPKAPPPKKNPPPNDIENNNNNNDKESTGGKTTEEDNKGGKLPPTNKRDAAVLYFNFPPESSAAEPPTKGKDPRDKVAHFRLDPQKPQNPSDKVQRCPIIKVPKVNNLHKPLTKLPTIAYSIVVHKRADLLRSWLQLTWDEDNFYMIHVDARSADDFFQEVQNIASQYSNVDINPERYYTTYYGWSVMWNHLSNYLRMKQLGQKRDYYINVSGMELPIQTRREIRFFLGEHEPASFVQEYCAITETRSFWVSWTWAEVKAGLVVVNKEGRNLPAGVTLHYGSQYSILHRNIVEWMLDDLHMLHLIYWLRNTKTPEDVFFVTAARSSPFKNTVFNYNNMKYTETNQCCTSFKPSKSTPCTLGVCDMERISKSASLFLSRVDSEVDAELIPYVHHILTKREEEEKKTKKVKRLPIVAGQTLDPPYASYE